MPNPPLTIHKKLDGRYEMYAFMELIRRGDQVQNKGLDRTKYAFDEVANIILDQYTHRMMTKRWLERFSNSVASLKVPEAWPVPSDATPVSANIYTAGQISGLRQAMHYVDFVNKIDMRTAKDFYHAGMEMLDSITLLKVND